MQITSGLKAGQVLQRLGSQGANITITGQAKENGPIVATISGKKGALKGWKAKKVGAGQAGEFTFALRGIPAGGPYRLVLQAGKEKLTVPSFYVGDVWVMAGQSNMQGSGNMNIPAKPHPLVRVFSMRHEWRLATDPLHILSESPDPCHYKDCGGAQATREAAEHERRKALKGASPGIYFGRDMLRQSGVPQGLIATAHGGTGMDMWLTDTDQFMYGSMIRSVRATGQPIAGVLWYQGESDANEPNFPHYVERMKTLVAATRRDLGLPKLPWVIVQLSRLTDPNDDSYWNKVQEAQRLFPQQIERLETVAAIDLPLDDNIHIGADGYIELGRRLAYVAGQMVYGGKKRPPQLEKITRGKSPYGEHIDVTFSSVEGGLRAAGVPNGFKLVTSEGQPLDFFRTSLHGNTARLHFGALPENAVLHHGWGRNPYCNITDGRGLPLSVFGPLPVPPA